MSTNFISKLNQAHRRFLQLAQSHPGTLTVTTLAGSVFVGVGLLYIFEPPIPSSNSNNDSQENKMTWEQARLRAMIENAQQAGSWKQNLEQAVQAQEHFMLPGRSQEKGLPTFMEQIEKEVTR